MFCQYCGSQIPDGSAFCSACGSKQQVVQQPQPAPTYQQPQQTYQQPVYQQPQQAYQQAPAYQQPAYQQPMPGMKWHKFVCVLLWLSAIGNLYNGITNMGGYAQMQKLYGGFCIVIAVLCVMTTLKLQKYKADGPKLLNLLMLISGVGTAVFMLWQEGVFSGYSFDLANPNVLGAIFSLLLVFLFIRIHKTYYGKRAYLFTN